MYALTRDKEMKAKGDGEGWLTQPHMLAAELKRSVATAECCCAYNMLKLARQAYTWTADPRYFDYYERILINHRIGTIQPKAVTPNTICRSRRARGRRSTQKISHSGVAPERA